MHLDLKPSGLHLGSRLFAVAATFALSSLAPLSALAQDWPTRPVRIVLAVGPGSSGDTLARLMAPRLEAIWKQPVIVENKPGAGGILGTEHAINSKDGHTLLLASQSSYLPKFTQANPRFDPTVDLIPVYKIIEYDLVLATNAQTAQQAKTLADVVKLSNTTRDGLFFSGTGPTSIFNVTMGVLNKVVGAKYTAVSFNNVGAMNIALMRNDAQLMLNTPSSIKGHIDSGALVPLAAISAKRYANLPNVPTIYEAVNYSGYLPVLWAGMVMPKGTPPAVVERVARDIESVVSNPETKQSIETTLSGLVQQSSPNSFSQQIRDEMETWKSLGIKPE